MKIIPLSIFAILFSLAINAQNINQVNVNTVNDSIIINYGIEAHEPVNVEAFYKSDSGKIREITNLAEGDIGLYIHPGKNKKIAWKPKDTSILSVTQPVNIELKVIPFIKMALVEGGVFMMGCTDEQIKCDGDEKRVHRVRLSTYYMSRYEITNAQYSVFLNAIGADPIGTYERDDYIHITNPNCMINYVDGKFKPTKGKENYPVLEVTWYGAQAFCEWAGGNLPTEAEWEYAARGGQNSKNYIYSGSNEIDEVAWYDKNSKGKIHKTGEKQPNELGIYDMSGNVWEWCYDWYDDYSRKTQNNPVGPKWGYGKVIRGGSSLYYGRFCRVSNRGSSSPEYCFNNYGFRLVKQKK